MYKRYKPQKSDSIDAQRLRPFNSLTAPLFNNLEMHNNSHKLVAENIDSASANESAFHVIIKTLEDIIEFKLENNKTSMDFVALLPLEAQLEDYAATEKISFLPRKLTTQDALDGYAPRKGDIAYYAPWGNIAIFYKDFINSSGLVKLGTLLSGMDTLCIKGTVKVKIEMAP